jgi:hypothetical protein
MLRGAYYGTAALQVLECIKALPSKRLALLHQVDFSSMHQEELRAVQRYAGHMLGLLPVAVAVAGNKQPQSQAEATTTSGQQEQQGSSSRQATACKLLPSSSARDGFWQVVYNSSSALALDGTCAPLEGTCMAVITAEHVKRGECCTAIWLPEGTVGSIVGTPEPSADDAICCLGMLHLLHCAALCAPVHPRRTAPRRTGPEPPCVLPAVSWDGDSQVLAKVKLDTQEYTLKLVQGKSSTGQKAVRLDLAPFYNQKLRSAERAAAFELFVLHQMPADAAGADGDAPMVEVLPLMMPESETGTNASMGDADGIGRWLGMPAMQLPAPAGAQIAVGVRVQHVSLKAQ